MEPEATDTAETAPLAAPTPAEVLTMTHKEIVPHADALGVDTTGKIADIRGRVLAAMVDKASSAPTATTDSVLLAAIEKLTSQVKAVGDVAAAAAGEAAKASKAAESAASKAEAAHDTASKAATAADQATSAADDAAAAVDAAAAAAAAPRPKPTPPVRLVPQPTAGQQRAAQPVAEGLSIVGAQVRLPDGHGGPPKTAFGSNKAKQDVNPPISVEGGLARHLPDGWEPAEPGTAKRPKPAAVSPHAPVLPDGNVQHRDNVRYLEAAGIRDALGELRDHFRRSVDGAHPERENVISRCQSALTAADILATYLHEHPF